ncbi:FtsQ-type POTRA domain-containing protein [Paenibacillus sp. alder61]|uniref:FtsQ-type POTRA domain-containing protein n=1 Tax=Paenibacillus faecis TaxID=862114 RepID=A0A5D0CT49_9BACL|nr:MULTISPECIES: FtsQ-type POTRA domain-containing protein [Paenibacillus]MCA1293054.1 FtsQ-type POTRA domain-containing protein [Paenibacillus sp. alder61]TYA13002.1 FtsQ-type POTRA domain-containing protein [Paenibacillus faecis]
MPKTTVPLLKEPQQKKKSSRKLAGILFLLVLILLCVLFFRSSISKISEISFEGNTYLSDQELLDISGLKVGAPFFGTSGSKIESKLSGIKSIQEVRVDKSFPGKVRVEIQEYPVVAYELTADGQLNGLLANGTRVNLDNGTMPIEKPILTGWSPDDPNLPKLCGTLANIPDALTTEISEITPSPTVSYPDRIKMYTRSKFEVISAVSVLAEKAEYMNMIMDSQDPGILTLLDADTYVPYETSEDEPDGENDTTHK